MPSDSTAVLLAEDDAIVRSWVRAALVGSEFRVAGEADTARSALEVLARRRCDIVLVDQHLPDMLGTELGRTLRRLGVSAVLVLMSASPEEGLNEEAVDAGFRSCMVKSADPVALLRVLRATLRGEHALDARHPRRPAGVGALAPREREVLALVAAGKTNREVATELGISGETVKTLLERSYRKLGA
jgi:DNA-binding NarL/FixJ family response regulator